LSQVVKERSKKVNRPYFGKAKEEEETFAKVGLTRHVEALGVRVGCGGERGETTVEKKRVDNSKKSLRGGGK